jgi:hypothetical protein
VAANVGPANTAVFPWLAALKGTVDRVYYGTTAASKDDTLTTSGGQPLPQIVLAQQN